MYYVYVLRSLKDKRCYIGYTHNLERRLEDQNRGKSESVKYRSPFEIAHSEECATKIEAIRRERHIKSYKGGEAFKRLISKEAHFDPVV